MNQEVAHTLLLVEDDENDILFLKIALEKNGMDQGLQVAEDGAEAIAYLRGKEKFSDRTRYPSPDLIFLDLKLPHVMGLDVLKWIRSQPDLDMIVVIILTSSQQRSDIQQACSLGANSYLLKPTSPVDLVETMRSVKEYWLTRNQPTATRGLGNSVRTHARQKTPPSPSGTVAAPSPLPPS